MKRVELAPAARDELDAAAEHYEAERPGRGLRFYAAIERSLRFIATFPASGPAFPRVRPELGVRQHVVRGFPFVLAYRDLGDKLRVDAVVHTRRRPGYWARRVK